MSFGISRSGVLFPPCQQRAHSLLPFCCNWPQETTQHIVYPLTRHLPGSNEGSQKRCSGQPLPSVKLQCRRENKPHYPRTKQRKAQDSGRLIMENSVYLDWSHLGFHGDWDLGWTVKPRHDSARPTWETDCLSPASVFLPPADNANQCPRGSTGPSGPIQCSK